MEHLRLFRAPTAPEEGSKERFLDFLETHPNSFVSSRPDELIKSAIDDEGLFFVENADGKVIATTGFYRHTDQLAEIGSTLIDEAYQGYRLQAVMYHHILSWKYFVELIDFPTQVMAVVDHRSIGSWKNVERCCFLRGESQLPSIKEQLPDKNFSSIEQDLKRLYMLPREGLARNLLFVAAHGPTYELVDKGGETAFLLTVEFPYFRYPDAAKDALREEGQKILSASVIVS